MSSSEYLTNITDSNKTIEGLLLEDYQGVNYELIKNDAFIVAANHFTKKIRWVKTTSDADGNVGLMTLEIQAFDDLLDFMLDKFGWCPKVYNNQLASEIYIFSPKNEIESIAIQLATDGEYGWKGSLYHLAYEEKYKDKIGLIFATKPVDSNEQHWLLVEIDQINKQRSWSVHDISLEQVYYIMAEEINIPEPNYNPTIEQMSEITNGLSARKYDSSEFETTGMITAEKAVELLKDYSQAIEDEEVEKCRIYYEKLYSQKQANNLKAIYDYDDYDDDETPDFLDYLNELIDLLNHEEAVKLHVEIAKELMKNSYEKIYQYDLFDDLPSCDNFFSLIKLWNLTLDKCKKICLDKNGNELSEHTGSEYYEVTDVICISMIVTRVFEKILMLGLQDNLEYDLIFNILMQYNLNTNDVEDMIDIHYYVQKLNNKQALEVIIIDALQQDYYDLSLLINALDNPCSSYKILSFILDVSNGDYSDKYMYLEPDTIDGLFESLTETQKSELLMGIVKHPNVTKEILEQLTNSEDQKIAESASEKLQELN